MLTLASGLSLPCYRIVINVHKPPNNFHASVALFRNYCQISRLNQYSVLYSGLIELLTIAAQTGAFDKSFAGCEVRRKTIFDSGGKMTVGHLSKPYTSPPVAGSSFLYFEGENVLLVARQQWGAIYTITDVSSM